MSLCSEGNVFLFVAVISHGQSDTEQLISAYFSRGESEMKREAWQETAKAGSFEKLRSHKCKHEAEANWEWVKAHSGDMLPPTILYLLKVP